jgi:rod shape-determining protein MreC
VPRHRTARLAVLGSSHQRSAGSEFPSRSRGPLRRRLVICLLALAAIALITGTLRGVGPLQSAQGAGADAMRPFEVVAHKIASPFVDTYDYFSGLFSAKSEVGKLRKELTKAQELASQNAAAAAENSALRKALDYQGLQTFPRDFRGITTAVLTHGWPEPASDMTIAAGRLSGVALNDAVITVDGNLVGTVTQISDYTARVTLLTDASIGVTAVDAAASPKAEGVIEAKVDAQGAISMFLERVPKSANVKVDDQIFTAGWHYRDIDSIYPAGIPIGTVISVGQRDVEETKQIQIRPYADLGSLENVTVLIPNGRAARG